MADEMTDGWTKSWTGGGQHWPDILGQHWKVHKEQSNPVLFTRQTNYFGSNNLPEAVMLDKRMGEFRQGREVLWSVLWVCGGVWRFVSNYLTKCENSVCVQL